MAEEYDITIEQGATFQLQITWKDRDDIAIDLTGFTARMQIRRRVGADEVLVEATTENGYIALGGATGTVEISIPADVTEALNFKRGVYDLELESSGGIVTRLIQGCVYVSREVTRDD